MELSIVDYPSNGDATFQWAKVAKDAGVDVLLSEKGIMTKTPQSQSFDSIRCRVSTALDKKFGSPSNSWATIRDIYSDKVVFCLEGSRGTSAGDYSAPATTLKGGDIYEAPYTDDGTIAIIGGPTQVTVSYLPVGKAADVAKHHHPEEPDQVEVDGAGRVQSAFVPTAVPPQDAAKVAPAGWEDTVIAMKDHSEIDNPYALAWWMDDEGFTSHKAAYAEKSTCLGLYSQFKQLTPKEQAVYYLLSGMNIKF